MATAVPRIPGMNPEVDANNRAQQQYETTGVVPNGYVLVNGRVLKQSGNAFTRFASGPNGWTLPIAVGGGTAAGMSAFGGAGGAAAGGASASGAGSAGAAGATGGGMGWLDWLTKGLDVAGKVGGIASAASAGRANGRAAEAGINNNYDMARVRAAQVLEDALQGRAGLDLKQRAFALTAPQQRASNAVRGDALAGLQDANVRGPIVHTHGQVPQITGGMRPSLLSGNTRALGSQMSRDAMLGQMKGDTFTPLPPPQVPTITPPPQSGAADSILNGIGYAGAIGGAIAPYLPGRRNPYQVPNIPGVNPDDQDWQTTGVG